jgi:hypothetical protein
MVLQKEPFEVTFWDKQTIFKEIVKTGTLLVQALPLPYSFNCIVVCLRYGWPLYGGASLFPVKEWKLFHVFLEVREPHK